ncbi:nuclear protein localization protein 4 homolog [Clavelina lepadiformis]|uniref:nuclear protein localization protein 4 homolog n=1 Tax=Clavelina lepadiformis TaxID=159417 RepID=UPI004042F316
MIIRIQSHIGTKRLETSSDEVLSSFYKKIEKLFVLEGKEWGLFLDRSGQKEIPKNSITQIKSTGLKHGDMVYLEIKKYNSKNIKEMVGKDLLEDEIDVELWKRDGRIKQSVNGQSMFKVENLPLEPWDESYLQEKQIKFMSFHAYMRQQTSGVDKGKYFKLEGIKAACKLNADAKHSAVDLPSALTLNRQKFRHVDNIMFENRHVVDRFLNYWRLSGHQRMGFLYGRYSPHADVPLGIKAEICAIYEPPQESTANSLVFHDNPHEEIVDHVAHELGLTKIGWVITDLIAENNSTGTVKNTRNMDTYFLSSEECITAATLQNKHLNPCRLARKNVYGSKFVTVVISGDKNSQISFEGYQVSNQCMSLVADNCLLPTLDAPELGYIRESNGDLIVSDVYYKEKDKYGNEITKLARPLPLEYLLVDVPTAFSIEPQFTCSNHTAEFPIAHRHYVGHTQSLSSLAKYLNQFGPNQLVDALSDFHVLLYLATNETLPFKEELDPLLKAVRSHDNDGVMQWSKCASWSTLMELMKHADEDSTGHISEAGGLDDDMREAIKRSLQMN